MRSNTSDTSKAQATNQSPAMNKVIGTASRCSKKAAYWLTFGITAKQWLASIMICSMLSSIFALPVRAAIEMNADNAGAMKIGDANRFEPVNESLPVWKEAWRSANAQAEAWLTPMREVNAAYKDVDDKDADGKDKHKTGKPSPKEALEKRVKTLDIQIEKEKQIKVGQTFSPVAVARDVNGKTVDGLVAVWSSSNPDILKIDENGQAVALKAGTVLLKAGAGAAEKEITVKVEIGGKDSKEIVSKNASAGMALKAMNVAPDVQPEQAERPILVDEPPVLVSPGGNLGNPVGQTPPGSSTPAAALRMKERAGIGNFSFELPVASLPGRGISASVGMSYNSQLWTRSGPSTNYQYTYNVDGNWVGPGFQIGYGYLDTYTNGGNLPSQLVSTGTDGTRYQLDLTSGSGGLASYESSDGSFIKGDATYNTSNNVLTGITVTYTDGTKVLYGAANPQNRRFPVRITDVQGNYILITYLANDQVGKIASIQDTLGRYINFHYDTTTEQNLISVTVPGYNNSPTPRQTIRFYYESITLQTAGRFSGTTVAPTVPVTVLRYVYYPGTKTGFRYDYSQYYGMIYKVTRLEGMQVSTLDPDQTGAVVTTPGSYLESASTRYSYPGTDIASPLSGQSDVPKYNLRTDEWVGRDTSAAAPQTVYTPSENIDATTHIGTRTMTVTSPNGSISASVSIADPNVCDDGLIKEMSVTSTGRSIPWSKTTIEWSPCTSNQNPHVNKIIQTNEVGQAKATTFTYDDYDNPLTVREYDFDPTGQPTTELRRTETTYVTGSNYLANRLVHLPLSVKTIVNNTTVVVSRTDYQYDQNPLTDRTGIIQHDAAYNSNNAPSNARGNVTTTTTFINPTSAPVNPTDANDSVTTTSYDIAGNPVQATLNCCNLKTWVYDSTNNAYAYPTSETKGSDVQLTTGATYDFNTGLMRTATDENNQVTSYDYESDTLRPSKVTYPNGGYVQTDYSDKLVTAPAQLSPGYVRTTTLLDTNKTVQSYSYFDGHGASTRTATQTPDGWNISAMVYDSIGRPKKTYNPFYGSAPTDAIPGTVKGTEVTVYDKLDRATQVKLQDDTLVNTYYNEAAVTYTDPTGQSRQGTATRVKDQADKERRQIVDALGRVVRTDEPDTINNSIGIITAPNQPTYYSYDGNDNLSDVIQSDNINPPQERQFKYDALSRLTNEKQVEAIRTLDINGIAGVPDPNKWTKVMKYNAHGDIIDGYDARGVNTHFSYDGLNRVSAVSFSDGTPQVNYYYDQLRTGFYNKGALTRVETAAGASGVRPDTPATSSEFDYDNMGRVVKHRQWIDYQPYYLEYGYNLAGQLKSETYPSGKVVSTVYDAGGRLSSIADNARTYLSSPQYQGTGTSLSSMNLGNGTNQTFIMNDRLQMTSQSLNKGADVLQKYNYGYGQIDGSGNLDATKNNGQLGRIDSTIGTAQQWTQKFNYDSIGRLSQASEYRGDNGSLSYKQKFDYDRFGNLYRKNASNPTAGQGNPLPYNPIEDADISKTTNRFTASTTYDNAGNVTQDLKFRISNFWYDANGRMFKASKTDNSSQANSVYDASGNRIAEQIDGVWSFFIYDAMGKLVSEYGGLQGMDEGGVKYVLQDWQGSSRAILSNTGSVTARMDYTAFGEEIQAGVGQRTTAQGFGATNNLTPKYGSTERDKATGLDHTWFRKNENRAGRWTSPDTYKGSMSLENPQSFNRYSYVEDDPINYIDPSGLCTFNIAITNNNLLKPKQLQTMKDEISRIFRAAGQTINFVSNNADYYLSINAKGSAYTSNENAVGFTPLQSPISVENSGRVFIDRLNASAGHDNTYNQNTNNLAVGLGRAGSHEIGHFLLQQFYDLASIRGVMHASFNGSDWFSVSKSGLWTFRPDQIAKMNSRCEPVTTTPASIINEITPRPLTGGGVAPISYTGGGMSDADWAFFMLGLLSRMADQQYQTRLP